MNQGSVTPEIILSWLLKDKWKILIAAIVFGGISIWVALSIPNQYTSSTVVSSNFNEQGGKGALSKLGGLASLAGISVGKSNYSPEVLKEIISSNSFLAFFIRQNKLEKIVMAAEGFNAENNSFIYNDKIYNVELNKWVRKFKYPQKLEPADIELVKKFKESFSISYDRKTELVKINFKSYSPTFAKSTLEAIIVTFNEFMRKQELESNTQSLEYLKTQLASAKYSEVKLSLQQIMEEQYKNLALANTRKEFAFKTIEAPLLPVLKSEPKRAIVCIAITFAGVFLVSLSLLTIRILRSNNK
ncbi:Wzz/FepE/Etk N-terminal domain-containing protein [Pseudoalteromonas sp. G4]|uniref:Wzz/FepE/Etk N-terminal domain-containing protein n=1 Tax=Pseudoalteromonas sp. G4 TaxID=2992761 RepID=UPI00237D4956|nr:Wzz/FepE/Etk N-terminal domain-containing protein [Pseudoalteromonas sp. G4]MDE3271258.1 Wzz/FepE/Etk N-terminal domain-containing protein [Pseudoalteromonas sp. G4]